MSFQEMGWVVNVILIGIGSLVGVIFLAFPALAIISVIQLNDRRSRNRRDRWARQRVLEQAVAGIADHADAAPAMADYPDEILI